MQWLSHVRFLVPDLAADVASYRDTIGLKHDQPAWVQRVAHLRDASGRAVEPWSPAS